MGAAASEIFEMGPMEYSLGELKRHAGERFNSLVANAFHFSVAAHAGDIRKHTGLPYIIHPVHVACIIAKYVPHGSSELLAAALLHDVIEDTKVDYETVVALFGERVAFIVLEVTKRDFEHIGLSKAELKEKEIERLSKVEDPDAHTLKEADIYSNTRAMEKESPERFPTYVVEKWRTHQHLVNAEPAIRAILTQMFQEMGFSS